MKKLTLTSMMVLASLALGFSFTSNASSQVQNEIQIVSDRSDDCPDRHPCPKPTPDPERKVDCPDHPKPTPKPKQG